MPADELSLETAWQALCRLQTRSVPEAPTAAAPPLSVDSSGTWQATGPVSTAAGAMLDTLAPLVAHQGRLAVAQLGQSLDGRIATESGHSQYVNGLESRVHLHRLRALVDAVVVGAGTAIEDDPRLTVRHVSGAQPVRVILDPRGRVPAHIRLLQASQARTLHLVGEQTSPDEAVGEHVCRLVLPCEPGGGFAPGVVLDTLAQRGLPRVLIEGGGITVSRFLEAGVLHRLHLMVAPLLIGSGRPGLSLTPIETLDSALRPLARCFPCGDDTLFDLILA